MRRERLAQMTARKELEALKTAHEATLLLYDTLAGLEGPDSDWSHPRGRQKIAVGFLSTIVLRSARSAMAVISYGYVSESIGLKRRIGEALWRTEKAIDDDSGEHARRWVEGKPPSGGARDPMAWKVYSAGTHADIRMMGLEVEDFGGQKRMRVPIMPERQGYLANGLLTEIAVEVLDQAAIAVEWVREREFTDAEKRRGDKIVEAIGHLRERYFEGESEDIADKPGEEA
jgi:hypothetical protein